MPEIKTKLKSAVKLQLKGCVEELSNFAFRCFGKMRLKFLLMKHLFISFLLVAPMKNLYQQTRFDFPMPTIKFLCINYSSINKH